ncbi:cadherin-4-like [Brachyhypopomus gauderio]|uniref:cadherin-4-like n=1 Tax=Brachyhypopomus gauderio TaxID=698409 RepID=UPI004042630A
MPKMKTGFVIALACALVLETSQASSGGPTADPCRPGFSQSFYTVFISQNVLQGRSLLKNTLLPSGREYPASQFWLLEA